MRICASTRSTFKTEALEDGEGHKERRRERVKKTRRDQRRASDVEDAKQNLKAGAEKTVEVFFGGLDDTDVFQFGEALESLRPGDTLTENDFGPNRFPVPLMDHYRSSAARAMEKVESWSVHDHAFIVERIEAIDREEKELESELTWRIEGGGKYWPHERIGIGVDGHGFDSWSHSQIRLSDWSLEHWMNDILDPPETEAEVIETEKETV